MNIRGATVWLVLYRSSRPLVDGYDWGGRDVIIQKKKKMYSPRGKRVQKKKKHRFLYTSHTWAWEFYPVILVIHPQALLVTDHIPTPSKNIKNEV